MENIKFITSNWMWEKSKVTQVEGYNWNESKIVGVYSILIRKDKKLY